MKIAFGILLLLITGLIITSCQRELDGHFLPDNISDSTLLEKYVELDTTLPSGSDTISKILYTYDNQKRVKAASYTAYSIPADIVTVDYFYTGNDTLPYKIVETWKDVSKTYKDTTFLFYTNGVVSSDSTIEYDITNNQFFGTSSKHFTLSGSNVAVLAREYFNPGAGATADDEWNGTISKTHVNGNIATQDDNGTPSPVSPGWYHFTVSYDTHPNPFYRTEIPYPVLDNWVVQKNNTLSSKGWDIPASMELDNSYTYMYSMNGYPTVVRITDIIASHTIKGLFFYRN